MFRRIRRNKNEISAEAAEVLLRNNKIKANDKICFTTWNEGYLEDGDWAFHVSSCVMFGHARLIEDRKITEEKVRKLACKYYPSAEEVEEVIKRSINGVQLVAIEIEHVSGKKVHER